MLQRKPCTFLTSKQLTAAETKAETSRGRTPVYPCEWSTEIWTPTAAWQNSGLAAAVQRKQKSVHLRALAGGVINKGLDAFRSTRHAHRAAVHRLAAQRRPLQGTHSNDQLMKSQGMLCAACTLHRCIATSLERAFQLVAFTLLALNELSA